MTVQEPKKPIDFAKLCFLLFVGNILLGSIIGLMVIFGIEYIDEPFREWILWLVRKFITVTGLWLTVMAFVAPILVIISLFNNNYDKLFKWVLISVLSVVAILGVTTKEFPKIVARFQTSLSESVLRLGSRMFEHVRGK